MGLRWPTTYWAMPGLHAMPRVQPRHGPRLGSTRPRPDGYRALPCLGRAVGRPSGLVPYGQVYIHVISLILYFRCAGAAPRAQHHSYVDTVKLKNETKASNNQTTDDCDDACVNNV